MVMVKVVMVSDSCDSNGDGVDGVAMERIVVVLIVIMVIVLDS